MGKASRIKSEKAVNTLTESSTKKSKGKGFPTWLGTLIVVTVLLALVLTFVFFTLSNNGTFKRMYVIMETENFEVTVPMMSYMVYTEYQNLVSTYDSYSQQFGGVTISIPAGKGGTALDKNTNLRDQIYATQDEGGNALAAPQTWFDHFVELAAKDTKEMLAVCEVAYANGVELDEADIESIDMAIDYMEMYGAYYGYTLNGYLSVMYGEGVAEQDVRAMMELSALANKYNKIKSDEILAGVTDDMVNAEYEANNTGDKENKYDVFIDYIGFTFEADFILSTKTDKDAAAAENQTNAAKYEAKKAKYKALAEELERIAKEDPTNFHTKLHAMLQELYFEEEKEAALAKKTGENPTLTDEEIQACRNEANTRAAKAAVDAIVKNADTTASAMSTTLKDWLKDDSDPRKNGDSKKIVEEYDAFGNLQGGSDADEDTKSTDYKTASSTYSVYLVTSALHRNEGVVRSVGHILFKTDTYKNMTKTDSLTGAVKVLADRVLARGAKISAEEMAKELLTLMIEEGKLTAKVENGVTYYVMDEQVFEAYGKQYTEDGSVLYDDVKQGQMVENFDDWLFNENRAMGEVSYPAAISSEYGYHIMLYRGDEKPAWSHTIRVSLAEGTYDTWLKDLVEGTAFEDRTGDLSYTDKISG